MLTSTHFKIARKNDDDWFDAILNADTKLFIDPFLIFKESKGFWSHAHDKIIKHFDRAFLLMAEGNLNPKSLAYKKAIDLLTFREPRELCLGYTAKGTQGAGGGLGYAKTMADAIVAAIQRGLKHPRHFEELGILNEGIGSDRISDIAATILKAELIQYTQKIAARHKIPLAKHRIYAGAFDEQRLRWDIAEIEVPTNPFTSKPFLFVPLRFLNDLPVLNPDDWWDSYENERLRQDMNYEIMGRVDKAKIVAAARKHPEMVRAWTKSKEGEKTPAYDFDRDPLGVWQWDAKTQQFADAHPLALVAASTHDEFLKVIERLVDQFKLYIEQQGGWSLLWNDDGTDKPEDAAQLLFRGVVQHYCHANNISIDREVELGRGPVDFKFSTGYAHRAHLEIKKLHNGRFWNGLEQQLPTYMRADNVKDGWLLAVRYREGEAAENRVKELPKRVQAVAKKENLNLKFGAVDARRPLSASKLKA